MGFRRPTDIQYKSIPSILKGEDLLAIAQTGTGKTAAYAIPISDLIYKNKLKQKRADGVKCLVMVPTHELAIQAEEVFQKINKFSGIKTLSIYGGVDQHPQIQKLNKGIDIVVTTPGRMFDLIHQEHLRTNRVEILVLDEADHMLDLGFIKDIKDTLRHLPKRRQTLFISATINQYIKKISYNIVKQNAIRIQISPKDPVSKNVTHLIANVEMDDKRFFLERVVRENLDHKIIVFVRTKVRAERVCRAMERVDIQSVTIHSDKTQEERVQTMQAFKSGEVNMLIATDISARGIDIPDVSIVVNYDLPEKAENYVHRIGRTGRAKKKGFAYSFCAPDEIDYLKAIEEFIGKEIPLLPMNKDTYSDTVQIARDRNNDYQSIMEEIEELEKNRKKKKKK